MISNHFKISDDGKELIGISPESINEFFKLFTRTHRAGPLYVIKIVQATHSQRVRNYYRLILSLLSDHTGYTVDNLEKMFLKLLDDLVLSETDSDYLIEYFYDDECINHDTGELLPRKMKSLSKFTNRNMSSFIFMIKAWALNNFPNFEFPDTSLFEGEAKGRKNVIQSPDEKYNLYEK